MGSRLFPGLSHTLTRTPSLSQAPSDTDWWSALGSKESSLIPETSYICTECDSAAWVEVEEEEAVCRKCGTFLGYGLTSSAEYRWFGSEDRSPDPTRVGNPMNPLLPESSLGTRIISRPGESRAMQNIRKYHLWNVMPYRERTLWNVFEMLQVRAANAGVSAAVVEETKQLYAQVSPLCICRGQQKDALMAACLFESLKRHDTPRRPAEIAEMFKIDIKLITKGVKQFSGLLDEHLHAAARKAATAATQVPELPTSAPAVKASNTTTIVAKTTTTAAPIIIAPVSTPSTNFRHYLEPAIMKLDTPRSMLRTMEDAAIHMGNLLDELGVCPETTPPSLAACAISLACGRLGFEKANADIAAVCGISVATLQKCLKRIEPWKPTLFKDR